MSKPPNDAQIFRPLEDAMTFQSVPNTVEVALIYTQNGEAMQMTFHAERAGGYSQNDVDILSDDVDARVVQSVLPIQTFDCDYVRTEVRGLESIVDFESSNNGGAGPGGSAVSGLSNQVTYAVQRNSGLTGRSSRGRVYWIGLTTADLSADENFLNTADAQAVVAAIANMKVTLDLSGWDAVIVSRFTDGAKRAEGVTFPWVNTIGIDARVDTLRRRLPS